MKVSALFEVVTTGLLAGFSLAQEVPADAFAPRDFSADLRNFSQVQLMLHNLRSRIGIPFTAMRNVGLNFNQTLEVKPLDLVLLPSGYCFSCSTSPHGRPNPFRNEMVELDESQLLVACTDDSAGVKADEWPLMRACPGQEEVLRTFLLDVSTHGSRIAIPKARMENAPVFEVGRHICMPGDPGRTSCSTTPSFASATSTMPSPSLKTSYAEIALSSRLIELKAYISSIYQQKTLSNTEVSMASITPATTIAVTSSTVSITNVTKPEPNSAASSMILSSTNHIDQQTTMKPKTTSNASSPVLSLTKTAERPQSTPSKEQWPIPPTYTSPASANDGNNRFAAMYSMRSQELAEAASHSSALAVATSARAISAPTPPVKAQDVAKPTRKSLTPEYQPKKTTVVVMQRMESLPTNSQGNDADRTSTTRDCLKEPSIRKQGPEISSKRASVRGERRPQAVPRVRNPDSTTISELKQF